MSTLNPNGIKRMKKIGRRIDMPNLWKYDEKDLRDDVKLRMLDGWAGRVFHIISGDSGKPYWIYLWWDKKTPETISAACNCNAGFHVVINTSSAIRDQYCKHITNLLAFLKERGH